MYLIGWKGLEKGVGQSTFIDDKVLSNDLRLQFYRGKAADNTKNVSYKYLLF